MQYKDHGVLIKSEREKRSWEQSDLAKRLEIEQQTVSRWEKGESRPKYDVFLKLIDLFEIEKEKFLWFSTAGYELKENDTSLAPYLPTQNLSPEKFEFFCRDVIQATYPEAKVHRYGNQGDKQEGIDIYAQFVKEVWGYQCKRNDQFGAADIKKAIAVTTFKAKKYYILLSRSATAPARKEMLNHKDWTLLDREDISKMVRDLPPDTALRIVRNYFPDKTKAFLGREDSNPWLTAEEFFYQFSDKSRFFSHAWSFVGRKVEIEALREFEKGEARAIVIGGRGGIGKSRLLKAWSDGLAKSQEVRFLSAGSEVDPREYELLPTSPAFLVMDDAHERADAMTILSYVVRLRPNIKIIISTRPYGITRIKDELTRSGVSFDPDKIITLKDLNLNDAKSLATEILSDPGVNGDTKHAERIAEITKDCPLATVVGSRLVGQGVIKPELMNNAEQFREELLSRFRDVIAGEIGGNNPEAIKEILDFISMIQPLDPTDPKFQTAAEKILEKHYDRILKDITVLEDAGVLLRRGRRLRIAPDLLGDYVRAFAAYNEKNKSKTGYVDRIFQGLQDELATNMLVNIGQLDWRLTVDGNEASLLDEVWQSLKDQFREAKIFQRLNILDAVKKVSYYQPDHALELVKIAIAEPTDEVEEEAKVYGSADYKLVLKKIPPVLRYVAYDMKYLTEVLDILKELAKEDTRATNPHPDHPLRVLQDLASIEPRKPSAFNDAIADHIIEWLKEDPTDNFSPFDILDGMLETEGYEDFAKGFTITMKPFKVRAEAVAGIRAKIIKKAFEAVRKDSLPASMRGLKTLGMSLHYPAGILTQEITTEDRKSWDPGILEVLAGLEEVVKDQSLDPYIAVEVRAIVQWHANHGNDVTKPAAKKVMDAIPTSPKYELSRALVDNWGWSFEREDGDYRRDEAAMIEWRKKLVEQLFAENKEDFPALISLLEERVSTLDNAKMTRHGDPGMMLGAVMEYSPKFAKALGEHILDNLSSPLVDCFGVVLSVMGRSKDPEFIPLTKKGMEKNNTVISRCISRALGWALNGVEALPEEIEIVEAISQSEDAWTRRNIVRAVKRFPKDKKTKAIEILVNMDITDSKEVADEVLGEFETKYGAFETEDLTKPQMDKIFESLVLTPAIDEYQAELFLSKTSFSHPMKTAKLFMDRIEHKENNPNTEFGEYEAFPFRWRKSEGLRFHETDQYEEVLRTVRNWSTANPDSWIRIRYGADLFRSVSVGYDEVTLKVLDEWIASANEHQLEAAASLLTEAGNIFVWDKKEFVIKLLERANTFGEACYHNVCSSLYHSVVSGVKSGTPGQPFQEDINQRDNSYEMMQKLTYGSPAYKFYESIYNRAKREIELQSSIDEEDFNE